MALTQLIYYSAASHPLEAAELARILESAVRHNTPQGITRMLLYLDGSFMQVLEGEAAALDETMARIQQDPRHQDIYILQRVAIAEREFGQWSMGFRHLNALDTARLAHYQPFFDQGFDITRLSAHPGVAMELLRHFANPGY